MSRVCVKNIPRYITDEKLREHFASRGEVTDAKVIKTKDGRSRQFGFVGFRTEDEANSAAKYFDRTYFDNSRLSCEVSSFPFCIFFSAVVSHAPKSIHMIS